MSNTEKSNVPELAADFLEAGSRVRSGRQGVSLEAIKFSTTSLESFAFADWEPLIFDVMVVAAAVEYADRSLKRSPKGWQRKFDLRIPVHDPIRWQSAETYDALADALGFLTGDNWCLSFVERREMPTGLNLQAKLKLKPDIHSVIAYSDGMDSRAVAGLLHNEFGNQVVKVRLGTSTPRRRRSRCAATLPFAGVPYEVALQTPNRDSTARNRGFKFASIAGIAAYLTNAQRVVFPESGQGALGPVLVGVAHAYPDYRNHPLFAKKMERYFKALFGRNIHFGFPRLWNTKGETLRAFVSTNPDAEWKDTHSCWRSNQWVSVNGKRRHCGVCAACMLRRMSVYAAGLEEQPDTYVATDLSADTLAEAVDPSFRHANVAFSEYAHAGFLHLDHLADMEAVSNQLDVRVHASQIGRALGASSQETEMQLRTLLCQHKTEWEAYLASLGSSSFLAQRRGTT